MKVMINMSGIVCEKGINDMPHGWIRKSEHNKMVYEKWKNMLNRVYKNEKDVHYIRCSICIEWHWLSKFAEDFVKIDGYNDDAFLNGKLVLDKDIKSNGKNKEYSLNNCTLTTISENSKQAVRTRDNSYLKGKNNPFYGKTHNDKTRDKMSKNHANFKGSNNPKSKKIAQFDKDGRCIKIWNCIKDITDYYNWIYNTFYKYIDKNKTYKGFIWKYYKEGETDGQ